MAYIVLPMSFFVKFRKLKNTNLPFPLIRESYLLTLRHAQSQAPSQPSAFPSVTYLLKLILSPDKLPVLPQP